MQAPLLNDLDEAAAEPRRLTSYGKVARTLSALVPLLSGIILLLGCVSWPMLSDEVVSAPLPDFDAALAFGFPATVVASDGSADLTSADHSFDKNFVVHRGDLENVTIAMQGSLVNIPKTRGETYTGRPGRSRTVAAPAMGFTPTARVLVPPRYTSPGYVSSRQISGAAAAGELQPPTTSAFSRTISGIAFSTYALAVILAIYPGAIAAWLYGMIADKARRRASDFIVQWWARGTMALFGADVSVEGVENLPPADEPVMYTPNHCSFLDIFTLSGYMPRRFKYISKIEILRIPLIGWAMQMAKHITISRMDRASQMKTLKDAVETLKAGNSLVTFPEGTRSKDGRLADFKKGPFTMAQRAGVKIVPITIIGTHVFQPAGAFTPYARPRGVRIVIHPPIEAPTKAAVGDAMKQAREAVESALPDSMKPE